MTIKVQIPKQNLDIVGFRLDRALLQVTNNVEKTVEAEAINLAAYVKSLKLSDQVLHVRTGRLRRSITYRLERTSEGVFSAYVGTNVQYARVHENGFDGTVDVREFTRRNSQQLNEARYKNKKGKLVTGAKHRGKGTVVVKAHQRKLKIKARPFLQPSLEENQERITTNLRKALVEALRS